MKIVNQTKLAVAVLSQFVMVPEILEDGTLKELHLIFPMTGFKNGSTAGFTLGEREVHSGVEWALKVLDIEAPGHPVTPSLNCFTLSANKVSKLITAFKQAKTHHLVVDAIDSKTPFVPRGQDQVR